MNQCVPSWDLDEYLVPPKINLQAQSNSSNSLPSHVPSLDYEVAELTWENGQLAMHGLGTPRVVNKPSSPTKYPSTWDKPRAGGTLESIVNQATTLHPKHKPSATADLIPWMEYHRTAANPNAATTSVTVTMDALVPSSTNTNNNNIGRDENQEHVVQGIIGCSTRVGSCSGAAWNGAPRVGISGTNGSMSVGDSATCMGSDSRQFTRDTWERDQLGGEGFTTTSMVSQENTISGKEYTITSFDDHDSVCHSRSQQREGEDEMGKKKANSKSSVSTKRSRAADIHNQSERKRRDRINQRMKTLQKLVPNSSKSDKASMLDEVIDHLKQLQAQVNMMNRMNMSPMMLPLAMQQQQLHQMSMMGMGLGMGMGMGVMDMNALSLAAAGMPPVIPPAPAFNPAGDCPTSVMADPLSAFLACQSQPTKMEAYNRMAALYQQFQQPPGSGSGPGPR